jgi:MoxR-like ATPase
MANFEQLRRLRANVESVLLGKSRAVSQVLTALLAGGHVLLEDVPGVGKTVLARALARSVDCAFSRIQLTPDLLPTDILGVSIYKADSAEFIFKRGPIFANVVLADEINRTTPRTQSALLEAMNESQVSMDGQTFRLGPPFMVIATQNPFQFEGTYFLPENQLDRFMLRIRMGYPDRQAERRILEEQPSRSRLENLPQAMDSPTLLTLQQQVQSVRVDGLIMDYVIAIAQATRVEEQLALGLSPRGALALVQAAKAAALFEGRQYVVPDDVKQLVKPVVAHRVVTKALTQDSGQAAEAILDKILQATAAPQ